MSADETDAPSHMGALAVVNDSNVLSQGEEWGGEWAGAGQENYSGEFADSASSLHYDAYYGQVPSASDALAS